MLKPDGLPAINIDPLMLFNMWAHHIEDGKNPHDHSMIFAGLGKPTYLLNKDIISASIQYWQKYNDRINALEKEIHLNSYTVEEQCDLIAQSHIAIDYGLPQGDLQARQIMARALSRWYEQEIKPEDIIFTVGGLSALQFIFAHIHERHSHGYIIACSPYYPYYNAAMHHNKFQFIDLMQEPGYKLSASALQSVIKHTQKQNKAISAFLFCDPNNPMGTVVGKDEWHRIAVILENTSNDIPIILDEAYAEMVFNNAKHASLLTVCPEFKNRLIVLRSATKALSASGERMAVMLCFNEVLRSVLLDKIVSSYIHAPKCIQYAYANALNKFSDEKRNDLSQFYDIQVQFVQERLKQMGLQMPDPTYCVDGTFYVLANFSKFFGKQIPESAQIVLGKGGLVVTDEELCYSLLFENRIMVAPLSYFGADASKGYVRITCTGGIALLSELMNRIEQTLFHKK